MRLAVIGSREFSDARLMADELEQHRETTTQLVSGGARGADKMSERWARKHGIETSIYYPNHKQYRHPYHHRNRLIAENCDLLVAFWNGRSSGTRYTIDYARKIGKPVRIVKF